MNFELKASPARLAAAGSSRKSRRGSKSPSRIQRIVLVFSADEWLVELVNHGLGQSWLVEQCSEPVNAHVWLARQGTRIVVVDDAAIEETTLGWLLGQAHKLAPHALIAYVASSHSAEVERRARSHRVQYYVAKPVEPERIVAVLRAFAKAAIPPD
jgi:DNA-binding NtrC family response regulator